jgi:hypothetical protein
MSNVFAQLGQSYPYAGCDDTAGLALPRRDRADRPRRRRPLVALERYPSSAAFRAFRTGLDAVIGVAGERAIIVHTALAGAPGVDRSRLVSEIKQILRDYDGRFGGACMIVVSSSEFLSSMLRSLGTAALFALRLRTRDIFILGDAKEAAQRLAPIRGVPIEAVRNIIETFESEARRRVSESGAPNG